MKNIFLASVVLVLSFSTGFAQDETPASNVMSPDLINVHNQCIVQLTDAVEGDRVRGVANAFAKRAKSSIKYVYANSIKGFTINMPCQAADRAFGASALVSAMEPDSIVSISKGKPNRGGGSTPLPQIQDWGVVRVGAPIDDNSEDNNVSSNFTAWVIDTGVDLDHPDLHVNPDRGFSVFRGKQDDQNGHGTHVAGTIAAIDNGIGSIGVAPGATIVPVRVLDRKGSGTMSGVIAGVDFVAVNAKEGDCVNMSLGGGVSTALDEAVVKAAAKSYAYFALAAGNSGEDAINHSPARVGGDSIDDNIFTIAAIAENTDQMPSWSNYGDAVEYAAPGVSIFSLWKDGGTETISGTSMAAPHACAVLMLTGAGSDGSLAINHTDNNDNGEYPIIHIGLPE
ncbi:MAG TPA: S8 family peptidase [Methylococcaceae bacterium]|nr:S8 family peptidase [Methylococcaceae bacterium]